MAQIDGRIGVMFDEGLSEQLHILSEVYEKSPYDLMVMAIDVMFKAYLKEDLSER